MMKKATMTVAIALSAGLTAGAVFAKLPAAPAQTEEQKAEAAAKKKAADAKSAELDAKYQDKAAANYKKNKGMAEPKGAAMAAKKK
jgi:hypothetical protein